MKWAGSDEEERAAAGGCRRKARRRGVVGGGRGRGGERGREEETGCTDKSHPATPLHTNLALLDPAPGHPSPSLLPSSLPPSLPLSPCARTGRPRCSLRTSPAAATPRHALDGGGGGGGPCPVITQAAPGVRLARVAIPDSGFALLSLFSSSPALRPTPRPSPARPLSCNIYPPRGGLCGRPRPPTHPAYVRDAPGACAPPRPLRGSSAWQPTAVAGLRARPKRARARALASFPRPLPRPLSHEPKLRLELNYEQ